ncbi:DUF4124 domain-containing protein [Herminiimonas sp. NPDC097707]|uniref:DUF4124 domain-containing protein n=1 Tax=Herminiimonas sp. NPDC097707 TaxID=3364007 RepID=UPI00383A6670
MTIRIAFLFICTLLLSNTHAADIYQWVDENGRTQVSDVVPARYKNVATKVDTSASELTESQRQEARTRAEREKQKAKEAAQAMQPASPVPSAGQLTPSSGMRETECEALMRAYRESQECFAPFVFRGPDGRPRRGGRVREEAFLYCTSVPDPSQQCGSPPQYLEP